MLPPLTNLPARELLKKFGAGGHKPGSGSASAYYGMLAAQLLLTVIDLSTDPKRSARYAAVQPELRRRAADIRQRIYPALEKLFDEDAVRFDEVIRRREERDAESDPLKKRSLRLQAQATLEPATEIPLQIAEHCLQLAEYAVYVFEHGFRSARGDSGVAMQGALAAVAGCLFIIDLNMDKHPAEKWIEEVRKRKQSINTEYKRLSDIAGQKMEQLRAAADEHYVFQQAIAAFRKGNLGETITSVADIEAMTKNLQNILWLNRDHVWKHEVPEHPLHVLKPAVVLEKILDYVYTEADSLGMHATETELFEIAGQIDKNSKLVRVSKNFSKESQLFTAAHELGHALLHRQTVLHRDRSIDGAVSVPRNREEMQADKFAAYFLMPAKIVTEAFQLIYETKRFRLNQATAQGLGERDQILLRQKCGDIRGLSRLLAETKVYKGKRVVPLTNLFNASVETMAIRLEELQIVEF